MRKNLASLRWKELFLFGLLAVFIFVLNGREASGYPAGAAVSTGTNPILSYGGAVGSGSIVTILTAPADNDVIVTDVFLAPDNTNSGCKTMQAVRLRLEDGTELGRYTVMIDFWSSSGHFPSHTSYSSGVRVPAGQSLEAYSEERFSYSCASIRVNYAISGYLAQP